VSLARKGNGRYKLELLLESGEN